MPNIVLGIKKTIISTKLVSFFLVHHRSKFFYSQSAISETRTHTTISQKILNLSCLPIPS